MRHATRTGLILTAAGLFVAGAAIVGGTHSSVAQGASADTIELSAQQNDSRKPAGKPAGKPAPRANVQHRAPPHANVQHRAPPHANVQHRPPTRNVQQHNAPPRRSAPTRAGKPANVGPKAVTPQNGGAKIITRGNNASPKLARPAGPARTFTPSGARARTITAGRLRGMPGRGAGHTSIRGRNYSVWRSGYRIRHNGAFRTFVALSALGAIAIGANEFYPYAYVSAPENYCDGLTPDGCQLVWQDVETEEGDVIPQCVAYCPWQQ